MPAPRVWRCLAPRTAYELYEEDDVCYPDCQGENPESHRLCGYFRQTNKEALAAAESALWARERELQASLADVRRLQAGLRAEWEYLGKEADHDRTA